GAYREGLAERGLAVEGDLLAAAARALVKQREVEPAPEVVLVAGFLDLSPLQLELIDALAERSRETRVDWPAEGGESLRRRRGAPESMGFVAEQAPATRDDRPSALVTIAKGLVEGGAAPQASDAGAVRVVRAGSPLDKADAIARRARRAVLDEGHAWNDVLVV